MLSLSLVAVLSLNAQVAFPRGSFAFNVDGHSGPVVEIAAYDGGFYSLGHDRKVIKWRVERSGARALVKSVSKVTLPGGASSEGVPKSFVALSDGGWLCSVFIPEDKGSYLWCFDLESGRLKMINGFRTLGELVACATPDGKDAYVIPRLGSRWYMSVIGDKQELSTAKSKISGEDEGQRFVTSASVHRQSGNAAVLVSTQITFIDRQGRKVADSKGKWTSTASFDGGFVAAGFVNANEGVLSIFNSNGKKVRDVKLPRPAFDVSASGDKVVVGMGWDSVGSYCMVDPKDGRVSPEVVTHSRTVTSVELLEGGEIVTADDTGRLVICKDGTPIAEIGTPCEVFDGVAWKDDDELVLHNSEGRVASRADRLNESVMGTHRVRFESGAVIPATDIVSNKTVSRNDPPQFWGSFNYQTFPADFYGIVPQRLHVISQAARTVVKDFITGDIAVLDTGSAITLSASTCPNGSKVALVCTDGIVRVFTLDDRVLTDESEQLRHYPTRNFALFRTGDWVAWESDERTGMPRYLALSGGANDLVGVNIQTTSGCSFKPISSMPKFVAQLGSEAVNPFTNVPSGTALMNSKDVMEAPTLEGIFLQEKRGFTRVANGGFNDFETTLSKVEIELDGLQSGSEYSVFAQTSKDGILKFKKGERWELTLAPGLNRFVLRATKDGVTSGDLPFTVLCKGGSGASQFVPVAVMSVGIAEYSKEFAPLPFTINDVKAIQQYFNNSGAIYVGPPSPQGKMSRADLLKAVDSFRESIAQRMEGKEVDIVFYISSHGIPITFKGLRQSLIVTSDCTATSESEWTEKQGGVLWSELIERLRKGGGDYKPNAVLFIVDSCFAALVKDTVDDEKVDENKSKAAVYAHSNVTRKMSEEGIALYASCLAGQKSIKHPEYDRSAFTQVLLDSLAKRKDQTRVIDVVSDVAGEMRKLKIGQTPYYYPGPPTGTASDIVLGQGNR